MKLPRRIYIVAKTIAFSLACWAGLAATVLARDTGTPEKKEGSFLLSYMLVVMGVTLGMLVVCKSSRRREREKPEGYEERKKLLED